MALVAGKLTAPVLGETVARPRLTSLVFSQSGHVWIAAAAGYGKTTLAAELLVRSELPGAWYRFDALDHDPGSFFTHLAEALRPIAGTGLPSLGVEFHDNPSAFARHFATLLAPRLPEHALLVFDDYHLLAPDNPLHDALPALLAMLPAGLRVVVASRSSLPESWAKLELSPGVMQLGPGDLAFTADELSAVAQLHGIQTDEEQQQRLLGRTAGWITGLVLMLRGNAAQAAAAVDYPEGVFRYYAGELLTHATPDMRKFLATVSLLPRMTAAGAARLTGHRDAKGILARLHRDNFFIERHRLWRHVYTFHPLFREFLLERLYESLDAEDIKLLRCRAAEVLEDEDDSETAIELLLAAGESAQTLDIIIRHAGRWVEQGRWLMLLDWFARLPADALKEQPKARYWRGICLLHGQTRQARDDLTVAYHQLRKTGEWEDMHLAWCAVVQSILFEFGHYSVLDEWIDAWLNFSRDGIPRAAFTTRLRQKVLLFSALMFRRPQDPAFAALEKTLHRLVFYAPLRAPQRLQIGGHLLRYYAWTGNLEKSRLVVDRLRRAASSGELDPLSQQLWQVVEAMYSWYGISPRAGIDAAERGLAKADENGVHLMDFTLLVQAAYAAFALGDIELARHFIQRMEPTLIEERIVHFGHYQFYLAWLNYADGQPQQALERMRNGHKMAHRTGAPYVMVQTDYGYAQALFRNGLMDEAQRINDAALSLGRQCGYGPQIYLLLLNRAQFAQAANDADTLEATLREVLAFGRDRGYRHVPFWTHQDFAPLLAHALDYGIETGFVLDIIRSQQMLPHGVAAHCQAWPRVVSIQTLGRFGITLNGEALSFAGKVQHRPLDLLKLLIIEPRIAVSDAALALWPEADADSAQDNLKATLARLRKLVGSDTVIQQEGRLWIDEARAGCDLWSLEQALAEHAQGRCPLKRIRALYRGAFLPGDEHLSWVVHVRERLRLRFLAALEQETRHCLADQPAQVLELAEEALGVDPLAEPFYRLLMQAHIRLGQAPEAVRCYRRCQKTLADLLAIEPSAETRALYASLHEQVGHSG